jgi:hypothetical protein
MYAITGRFADRLPVAVHSISWEEAMRIATLILVTLLAVVVSIPGAALAKDEHVKWSDVRGIVQAGAVVGTGTGRVTGGALPWTTSGGHADVNLDKGTVKFSVRGLVFALGNSLGTRGGVTPVKGTLVCDTNGNLDGNSVLLDTDLVPLDEQGDADFHGNVGMLPAHCFEPDIAFLIRTAGGAWIAFGAVRKP